MTYFVRRFKPKLLVFITTGMFNLLSKILKSDPPERCPFWIEAPTEVEVSSNLCAVDRSLSRQTVESAFARIP